MAKKGGGEALFIEAIAVIAVLILIFVVIAKAGGLLQTTDYVNTNDVLRIAKGCSGGWKECYVGKIGSVNQTELERNGITIKYWEEGATDIKVATDNGTVVVIAWKAKQ
ncbi:MAG: hypothetical protein ACPL06_02655 [Candidatus Anstonellales archaeon]